MSQSVTDSFFRIISSIPRQYYWTLSQYLVWWHNTQYKINKNENLFMNFSHGCDHEYRITSNIYHDIFVLSKLCLTISHMNHPIHLDKTFVRTKTPVRKLLILTRDSVKQKIFATAFHKWIQVWHHIRNNNKETWPENCTNIWKLH